MAKKTEDVKVELSQSQKLAELRKQLEKDFGKGTLMGAAEKPREHDSISTGSLGLDKAIGIGGVPKGMIVEVYGPESSGKTTLTGHIIAEAQLANPEAQCAFIDAEHAIDTAYFENLGVDLDRLQISQPDYGEQALDVLFRVVESGVFDVVVLDSVAALVPKAELEASMEKGGLGLHARLMSSILRKVTALTAKTGTCLIFINQLREKIGVMFGSPEVTTGGNALKFYAAVRLDVRRSITNDNSIIVNKGKDNEARLGNQTTVKVVKNKCAPPFKKAVFDILYGEGIDRFGELVDMAENLGVVDKSGTWYSYQGKQLGQGRDAVVDKLKGDDTLYQLLKGKVIQTFKPVEMTEQEKIESQVSIVKEKQETNG